MLSSFLSFVTVVFFSVAPVTVSLERNYYTWDDAFGEPFSSKVIEPKRGVVMTDDGPLTAADMDVSDVRCDH